VGGENFGEGNVFGEGCRKFFGVGEKFCVGVGRLFGVGVMQEKIRSGR
jgi:hypothetical protein